MLNGSTNKSFWDWLQGNKNQLLTTFDRLASNKLVKNGARVIFECCIKYPEQRPSMYRRTYGSLTDAISDWLNEYDKGYSSRPSVLLAKPTGTIPDDIISNILSARLSDLTANDLKEVCDAHRLSMSAENLLGGLLEEYLADRFLTNKWYCAWYCAWGKTITSVDFCSSNYDLLQIKNRSNSENSSSDDVRDGTGILEWHRINAKTGKDCWGDLSSLTGCHSISESGFNSFVVDTISDNPDSLYVKPGNTWSKASE